MADDDSQGDSDESSTRGYNDVLADMAEDRPLLSAENFREENRHRVNGVGCGGGSSSF